MDLGWVVLGVVGWTAGLAFVLVLMRMAGDQDRAARDAETRLFPQSDAPIVRWTTEAGDAGELEIEPHWWRRESDPPGGVLAAIIPLNAPGGGRARSGEDGPIAPVALLQTTRASGDSALHESDGTEPAPRDIDRAPVGCSVGRSG